MSSMQRADSAATVSTSPAHRVVISVLLGLAIQSLVAVVYVILRYGPAFRREFDEIPTTVISLALAMVFGCAAVVRLRMPRETSLATVAVAVVLSNLVGGIALYFMAYLAYRGGLDL